MLIILLVAGPFAGLFRAPAFTTERFPLLCSSQSCFSGTTFWDTARFWPAALALEGAFETAALFFPETFLRAGVLAFAAAFFLPAELFFAALFLAGLFFAADFFLPAELFFAADFFEALFAGLFLAGLFLRAALAEPFLRATFFAGSSFFVFTRALNLLVLVYL